MVTHKPSNSESLADPALLDRIDKLFACNVGEYIDLPQLVVVGDQSSGKSSVLEGLTRLAFPRDSGLCTRFATQIIFRRVGDCERKITASIIPGSDVDSAHALQLRGWVAKDIQSLSAESFSKTMAEVHAQMGLSKQRDDGLPTFSSSILRLEICGPKEDHLSVIDVPGIFRNTSPGLTTKQDKTMVQNMVQGYMKNPRSIMLTVVPANVDIATQEIVEMARESDPDGERTLGVITKPDLVDKGAESKVIDLLEGKTMQFKLGWVVVRNLGHKELQDGDVDREAREEDLYREHPWNIVSRDKFGIQALRIRLQETVTANARRTFPLLRSETNKRLKTCNDTLQKLGAERETPEQQASYLIDIISSFQTITSHALNSNYSSLDQFEEDEALRLANRVVNRNDMFSNDMTQYGHEHDFEINAPQKPDTSDAAVSDEDIKGSEGSPCEGKATESRKVDDMPDLEEILADSTEISQPLQGDIRSWIEKQYRASRGFEIGTFNFALLSDIMKRQSCKWTDLAHGYVSDVIIMVHGFICKALSLACLDTRVCQSLQSVLMDRLLGRYQRAVDEVTFLLYVERTGTPMTLNHHLNDTLEECRQERINSSPLKPVYNGGRITQLVRQGHTSNFSHTIQDLHDILQSYYQVARKRFVDNICMQAAGYYLVNGPETPMKLLSPSFVGSLTREQLDEIAGEEAALRRHRGQLQKEIKDLQTARKILL